MEGHGFARLMTLGRKGELNSHKGPVKVMWTLVLLSSMSYYFI